MKLAQLLLTATAVLVSAENAEQTTIKWVKGVGKKMQIFESRIDNFKRRLASDGDLTDSDKTALLDMHNDYRSALAQGNTGSEPGATNMNKMEWDDRLASVAKSYSAECYWDHNPDRTSDLETTVSSDGAASFMFDDYSLSVGENLYASSGRGGDLDDLKLGLEGWWDEYNYYTYEGTRSTDTDSSGGSCSSGEMCGHYTQMAWAETRYVGCGYTVCGTLVFPATSYSEYAEWSGATFLVCNYFSAGNDGTAPYVEDTGAGAASQCDTDRSSTESGLCAGCMSEYWDYCTNAATGCTTAHCPSSGCNTASTSTNCHMCRTTCNTCTDSMLSCSDSPTSPTPKPTPQPTAGSPSDDEDLDGNCATCSVTLTIDGYYTDSAMSAVYPAYYQCYYALKAKTTAYYISGSYSTGTDNYGSTFTLVCTATIYDHDESHTYQEYITDTTFATKLDSAVSGYGSIDSIRASDVTSVSGAASSNISVDNDNGKITISWWAILLIVAGLLVVGLGLGFVIGRCRYKNSPGFQPQATY